MAAAVAIATVLIAKYTVVSLLVPDMGDLVFNINPEQIEADEMIAGEAAVVTEEWKQAGRKVDTPLSEPDEEAPLSAYYAPDVWTEAQKRWAGLSPEEQQERKEEHVAQMKQAMENLDDVLADAMFSSSFSGWDLL
jgi:hypothetical protein